MASPPAPPEARDGDGAASEALLAVLRPLARLAIDLGVPFGQLEELTKRAMVEAALRATADASGDVPPVSRLSVITGIHRKEVKRLVEGPGLDAARADVAPTAELFTRWMTDPAWRGADGRPAALPRRPAPGGGASFEQLARAVTTDVHPRTLLDELLRLELVAVDPQADTVALRADAFVPASRLDALLGLLGPNVGDHLAAARANVDASRRAVRDGRDPPPRPPFVEQALWADELSEASVSTAVELARAHWQALLQALAPALQRLEDDDRAAGRPADRRMRIGLYSYSEAMPPPPRAAEDDR